MLSDEKQRQRLREFWRLHLLKLAEARGTSDVIGLQ